MAKTLCQNYSPAVAEIGPSTTKYIPIVGIDSTNTTETNAQINSRGSGTYSKLRARFNVNSLTTATYTIRFRKNAANGNQVINVSAGSTGTFEDASNTDTCAAGDDVCYTVSVAAGGSGTARAQFISSVFNADSNTMTILISNHSTTGSSFGTASTTRFYALNGVLSNGTTESSTCVEFREAATMKNMQINIISNARVNTTTYRSRKNSANGNLSIAVGSGATGQFEDSSNTDSVTTNDVYCLSISTGTGTQTIVTFLVKVGHETTTDTGLYVAAGFDSNATSQTIYNPIAGNSTAGLTADTDTKHSTGLPDNFTAKNLGILISANTVTAASVLTLMKNGSATALTVSVASSSTGQFEDTTNTVSSIQGSDELYTKWVTGATGTSIALNCITLYLVVAGAVLYPVSLTEASISVSDSISRTLIGTRTSSEPSISVSDSLARLLTATRTLSESSISVSDSLTRIPIRVRFLSESAISVSDSLARLLIATRSLADTVTVSDARVRLLIATRTLADTISVSDSLARRLTAFRTLSDTVTVSDSLVKMLSAFRTISESSIGVSDSLTRLLIATRTMTESSISVSESVTATLLAILYTRPITDPSISVSDSLVRSLIATRTLSESSISVSDSLARLLIATRTLADTISVSDSLTRVPIRVRSLADTVSVSDSLAKMSSFFRTITESSISVSDSLARLLIATRTLSEGLVSVTDSLTKIPIWSRIIADTITVSDALARLLTATRALSEPTISVSDARTRLLIAVRSLADTIAVSDSLARQLVPIISLPENVTVSDSLARIMTAFRTLADTISVSDSLAAARLRVRLITETAITVSDSLARRLLAFRVLGETVFVSEVMLVVGPDYEVALYVSDRGYSNPLRARIQFISNAEPYPVFYTYDSFNPDARPFNIVQMSVRLAQGEIGAFSMTIEDSAGIVDKAKIGLGVKVVVEVRKEFATPYFKLITGFIRRIKPLRPATGALLYQIDGYGSQVIFNERIVNFKRAAKRTAVDSTIPLSTDSQMQAYRLFSDLITATDIVPLKKPTIQTTGRFELTEVSPEVTDFIAQIAPGLTDAATVANALAEITGSIWGTDANGNPFFRYPTQKHSGILVKDAPTNTDPAANTSINLDAFEFDDSIDVSEGFANRLYVLNAVDTKSTASSSKGSGSTTLTTRGIAQQWTATDNNVTSAAFILSRVGNPVTASGSISGKLRADNNGYPNGATLATFEIPISSIDTSRSTIFVNDIKTKDGVINPGQKYWWYLLGTDLRDDSNTVRWHHDNDLSTPDRYSAQLPLVDADPTKPGEQLKWIRSVFGPVYAFSTFSSVRHILTQSDSESIKQYGLIEGIVDLPSFDDDATFQKALAKIIYTSAKPKRTYEYNRLTIPTQRIFMPGEMITLVDSKASLTSEKSINAEIAEVNYNFDTGTNAIGCKYVDIRLIAFLDQTLDDYMDTREC